MGHPGVILIRQRANRAYGHEYAVIGHEGQDRAERSSGKKEVGRSESL